MLELEYAAGVRSQRVFAEADAAAAAARRLGVRQVERDGKTGAWRAASPPRPAAPGRPAGPAADACRRAEREFVDALIEHGKAEARLDDARRRRKLARIDSGL